MLMFTTTTATVVAIIAAIFFSKAPHATRASFPWLVPLCRPCGSRLAACAEAANAGARLMPTIRENDPYQSRCPTPGYDLILGECTEQNLIFRSATLPLGIP